MYYDDEARRFNFLSGLLLGGVLGAGLALVASPQRRRNPRHLRSGYRSARGGAESGYAQLRDGVSAALAAVQAAKR